MRIYHSMDSKLQKISNCQVGGVGVCNGMKSARQMWAHFSLEIFYLPWGTAQMLAGLTSSAISENIKSQPFVPLQVRRDSAWTLGCMCVPGGRWGRGRGVWQRRDSNNWLEVLNAQQTCNTLVLVILRKSFLEHSAMRLLLFSLLIHW